MNGYAGKRIMNMRYLFNLREDQKLNDEENMLPRRCIGSPPQKEGPLRSITVNQEKMSIQFLENMAWKKETLIPTRESLESLGGMENVIRGFYE